MVWLGSWLGHPAAAVVLDVDVICLIQDVRLERAAMRILVCHTGVLHQCESIQGKGVVVIKYFFDRLCCGQSVSMIGPNL